MTTNPSQTTFTFSTADKSIDHALSPIEEVPKLCLPQYQVLGAVYAKAIFIPKDSLLIQRTVGYLEVVGDGDGGDGRPCGLPPGRQPGPLRWC